ncbi:winged helix-turn-helix domain-containing protein [Pararhizobium sp. BT-229]|uniref:ArsR/SmtB family transcription factor n=1 Tax=Pararhizobium sp. BT-229 TaxID=2986923 RepID=UPI0021F7D424|nr:winged helix-turn-helix domain-containing protein [Pararhizobium sp. BT-229]MCV9963153.1 winged helix-turn-helix domain-containing protein [Pararhizobium sp. BT-229]
MKEGPDIALIGSLIGDPARANMLTALTGGKALTATELAGTAGITLQTASSHLSKLEAGGLIAQRKQGRHRYFALADDDVGLMIEGLMGFAAYRGFTRHRTGPKDPALRKARVCYNHLAGDYGVRMLDSLVAEEVIEGVGDKLQLTKSGEGKITALGIDLAALVKSRRPVCRACLDWSERRSHLSGSLGQALLTLFLDKGWAKREPDSRAVRFTGTGEKEFAKLFPLPAPSTVERLHQHAVEA